MPDKISRILLWLFVVNLGLAVGAGLYESRIVVPHWIGTGADDELHWNAEAARRDNTGLRFWVFVTTVPLTLLTFGNLAAAWSIAPPVRAWWLGAVAAALLDRVITFSYFVPTMLWLMQAADSPAAAAAASWWANLNHVRHALLLAAWLAALRTVALLYVQRGAEGELS
jgi:hypothetical protein